MTLRNLLWLTVMATLLMAGANLIGLTAEREWIVDPGTYSQRSTSTTRVPGALIADFTLTL